MLQLERRITRRIAHLSFHVRRRLLGWLARHITRRIADYLSSAHRQLSDRFVLRNARRIVCRVSHHFHSSAAIPSVCTLQYLPTPILTVCAPQSSSNSALDSSSLPRFDGYPVGLRATILAHGDHNGLRGAILVDGDHNGLRGAILVEGYPNGLSTVILVDGYPNCFRTAIHVHSYHNGFSPAMLVE